MPSEADPGSRDTPHMPSPFAETGKYGYTVAPQWLCKPKEASTEPVHTATMYGSVERIYHTL
jgi:hypothetical protein